MPNRLKKVTDKLDQLIAAKGTHPYARWSVIDANAQPECAALRGKAWRVGGYALSGVVQLHLAGDYAGCRCNLVGMTERSFGSSDCVLVD